MLRKKEHRKILQVFYLAGNSLLNGDILGTLTAMCPPGYHHNSFVATHALGHSFFCEV